MGEKYSERLRETLSEDSIAQKASLGCFGSLIGIHKEGMIQVWVQRNWERRQME